MGNEHGLGLDHASSHNAYDKHYSWDDDRERAMTGTLGGNSKELLKSYVERIERLEEERKALGDDIKDIFKESKDNGFDVKALKAIVKRRKQDTDEVEAHEALVETYLSALGDFVSTPLGRATMERVGG